MRGRQRGASIGGSLPRHFLAHSTAITLHRYGAGPVGFILAIPAARIPWTISCQSSPDDSGTDVFAVASVASTHPAVVGLMSGQNASNHPVCIVCSHPCLPFLISGLAFVWCIYTIKAHRNAAHLYSVSISHMRDLPLDFFCSGLKGNTQKKC